MNTSLHAPPLVSGYADCLEAVRARLAAREAKLYGIAVLVVYVHQLERLFASAGHVNAARMLDELRNRLSQVMKPGDYFARLGDRKFVFVLSNLRNSGHALLAANKILRTAAEPVSAGGQHASVRLSIGVAMHPAHGRTPEQLMQCADIALLEAWKTQAATVVYTERKAEELVAGWDLETQLANALEHGDLVLNYQPKLSLPKLEVVGCRGADALEPAGRRQRAARDLHRRRRDDGPDRPADTLRIPPRAAPARRVAEEHWGPSASRSTSRPRSSATRIWSRSSAVPPACGPCRSSA